MRRDAGQWRGFVGGQVGPSPESALHQHVRCVVDRSASTWDQPRGRSRGYRDLYMYMYIYVCASGPRRKGQDIYNISSRRSRSDSHFLPLFPPPRRPCITSIHPSIHPFFVSLALSDFQLQLWLLRLQDPHGTLAGWPPTRQIRCRPSR